ncbi:MAG: ArnT family glycosyltransferase [Gammaproteobacteria bacterium]
MKLNKLLWSENAKTAILFITGAILIFFMLDAKSLWTMEQRWASIINNMLIRHDYLHPYLGNRQYYDKPLLSYWLILPFVKLFGFHRWTLRLPSAIAGFLALWTTYRIGYHLKNKSLGLIAGWLLLSSYFFIFYARVASADMLNIFAILAAFLYYLKKFSSLTSHSKQTFIDYLILFLILTFGALCKGLVAPVCVFLIVLPDLIKQRAWKTHFNFKMFSALIIAALIYFIPFLLSSYINKNDYQTSGLTRVLYENFVRFVHPWDHKNPAWHYFIEFPVMISPWIIFFLPALYISIKKWSRMPWNTRWLCLAFALLFIFFTLSRSRRFYYLLPLLPIAILITSDWLNERMQQQKLQNITAGLVILIVIALFLLNGIILPMHYMKKRGGQHDIRIPPKYSALVSARSCG